VVPRLGGHRPLAKVQVRWITFHSGYDFGYLVKLLTCSSLPANESEFFELLKVKFAWRTLLPITVY
jgi:hypothetical protein